MLNPTKIQLGLLIHAPELLVEALRDFFELLAINVSQDKKCEHSVFYPILFVLRILVQNRSRSRNVYDDAECKCAPGTQRVYIREWGLIPP